MQRDCLVPYTQERMAGMKDQLAKLVSEYMTVESEKKNADEGYNEQLKALWSEIAEIEPKIKAGGEMEPVECKRTVYPEEGMTRFYRQDTGEMVEERAWTKEEEDASRQMDFPEDHMLPPPDPDDKFPEDFGTGKKKRGRPKGKDK